MLVELLGTIDECGALGGRGTDEITEPHGSVIIRGWACSSDGKPVDGIRIVGDGDLSIEAWYGHDRPDVAAVHGPEALPTGFYAVLADDCLRPGGGIVSILARIDNAEIVVASQRLPGIKSGSNDGQLFVDWVLLPNGEESHPDGPVMLVPADSGLILRGWALDAERGALATLDGIVGNRRFAAVLGLRRDDLAQAFANPNAAFGGFRLPLPRVGAEKVSLAFEGRASNGAVVEFPQRFEIIGAR